MFKKGSIKLVENLVYIQTKINSILLSNLNIYNYFIKYIQVFIKKSYKIKILFTKSNYKTYNFNKCHNIFFNSILNKPYINTVTFNSKLFLRKYFNFLHIIQVIQKHMYKHVKYNTTNKENLLLIYKLLSKTYYKIIDYISYKTKKLSDNFIKSNISIINVNNHKSIKFVLLEYILYLINKKYINNIIYTTNNIYNINYCMYKLHILTKFKIKYYNICKSESINYIKSNGLSKEIILFFINFSTKDKPIQNNNSVYTFYNIITKFIFGQAFVIKKLTTYLNNFFNKSKTKPLGSFLLCGPSGTGKTEIVKLITNYLHLSQKNLIQLDMSEYKEKHSIAKIIGSPPGYKGYETGGNLINKINCNPDSIILFDEIEKAHPDLFSIFLQILDEGILTDSKGISCRFNRSIIFFTSNLGSGIFKESGVSDVLHSKYRDNVKFEITKYFKPEFVNRINDIIIFNPLLRMYLYSILDKYVYTNYSSKINLDYNIKPLISHVSYSTSKGSRFVINNLNGVINNVNLFKNNKIILTNNRIKYFIN